MMKENSGKIRFIAAMAIFGSIGLFRRSIDLPSSVIAVVRGILGAVFLLVLIRVKREKLDTASIRKSLLPLLVSGMFIGINWILLFEAYNYTTVAIATLCYYFAPVIVILLSPFVLGEKLTVKKILCVLAALLGMVFVSGVTESGFSGGGEFKGVLLGIGAAVFYSMIILINKKSLTEIGPYETTVTQLMTAGVSMIPYVLLTEQAGALSLSPKAAVLLLFVSFVHTGLAYYLYFGGVKSVPAQTVAIFSYIDPVLAIVLSAVLLKEPMSFTAGIGAVLILSATLISELPAGRKKSSENGESA